MDSMQIAGYAFDQALFMEWAEKIFFALVIVTATWALAKGAKWTFARMVDQIGFFQRGTASGESVGMALGRIVSLLIWLVGLLIVLQQLGFSSVVTPVEGLLGNFIGYLDNIVFAVAIFFVGSFVARIVRELTETTLTTINLDRWANIGGVEAVTGNSAISKTIGSIAYVLVIIPFAIGALDILDIAAITTPAQNLLNTVFQAILPIIGACILLGLGYVISRWVGGLIRDLLPSLGADRAINELGILPEGRTASGVIATIVTIAVMIFFAIAATDMLGFPQLTDILETVLAQAGNVAFGAVLIALGVFIAKILQNLIGDATGPGFASNVTYWITVGLFLFIGLKQMDIGGNIPDYAFLAVAGGAAIGIAIAFALAFGLGGRDAAARILADLRSSPAAPSSRPTAKMTADLVARAPAKKPVSKRAPRKASPAKAPAKRK
ncbi:MAG: mechanosensitive ion channel [Sphingorhabdus sp.]